jgi:hypothetical protein
LYGASAARKSSAKRMTFGSLTDFVVACLRVFGIAPSLDDSQIFSIFLLCLF